MEPESTSSRWATLEAQAHLPEVQAVIRREIMHGDIRVVPAPGGGIRIIPFNGSSPVEEPAPAAAEELELVEVRRAPVLRVRRRAQ
jgi:hypothetical protein